MPLRAIFDREEEGDGNGGVELAGLEQQCAFRPSAQSRSSACRIGMFHAETEGAPPQSRSPQSNSPPAGPGTALIRQANSEGAPKRLGKRRSLFMAPLAYFGEKPPGSGKG